MNIFLYFVAIARKQFAYFIIYCIILFIFNVIFSSKEMINQLNKNQESVRRMIYRLMQE